MGRQPRLPQRCRKALTRARERSDHAQARSLRHRPCAAAAIRRAACLVSLVSYAPLGSWRGVRRGICRVLAQVRWEHADTRRPPHARGAHGVQLDAVLAGRRRRSSVVSSPVEMSRSASSCRPAARGARERPAGRSGPGCSRTAWPPCGPASQSAPRCPWRWPAPGPRRAARSGTPRTAQPGPAGHCRSAGHGNGCWSPRVPPSQRRPKAPPPGRAHPASIPSNPRGPGYPLAADGDQGPLRRFSGRSSERR
jgi:hypothetical protein